MVSWCACGAKTARLLLNPS